MGAVNINYLNTYLSTNPSKYLAFIHPYPRSLSPDWAKPHPPSDMETLLNRQPDGTWQVVVKADGYEEAGVVYSHNDVRAIETRLMHTIYRRAQQDFFGDSTPCDI